MDEQNPNNSAGNNSLVIAGSIILAGAIIASAVIYANNQSGAKTGTASVGGSVPTTVFRNEELVGDGPVLGNPQAPVTMVEFADFQCPFCGKFFHTAEQQIIDKYVKTGKVKLVYRHFAFLGPESLVAANAAECAREQGKFWEYHDYLFNNQGSENEGFYTKDRLKNFAAKVGLDAGKFNGCLDSDRYTDKVKKDTDDGRKFGVTGTPANFINGRKLVGSLPFSKAEADAANIPYGFETVIEEELAKVK